MFLRTIILVGLLNIAACIHKKKFDYCDKKMCPYQGIHVACNKTKRFSETCTGITQLEDMTPYIELILEEHNYYRNLIASGKVKCFYPAVRMLALQWDSRLAENAEYNVRTCVFAHDECRSTEKFPMAGQNIYRAKTSHLDILIERFIKEAIFLWFEEQYYADQEILLSFRKTKPQTGHFTLLVNDRQNRVGCAFLNNELLAEKKRSVIFTCNYSSSNICGLPSYKPGKAAANCKKRHKKFQALCEDAIDPNNLTWYNEIV